MASSSLPILKMSAEIGEKMLKPRIVAAALLKKRTEEKSRFKKNHALNSAEFHIIGSDCQGFSPSLIVNSEGRSYLFNCSEGTQRFCHTNKIKLSQLENIFLTDLNWNRMSGIYGISLSLQDIGMPSLCVHSTNGIESMFEAARSFMSFHTGMKCFTRSNSDSDYSDIGIKVHAIQLDPCGKPVNVKGDLINCSQQEFQSMKKIKTSSGLVVYFCSFPDMPGALDPQKCRDLNIPVGRLLAKLKSGQDIVMDDGRLIKSTDVCAPRSLGLRFLVLECPHEDYIDNLNANSKLNEIQGLHKTNQNEQVDLIVHFSPEEVVNNSKYQDWIRGFGENCKHLFISDSESRKINFIDSYRSQYLLRHLDNKIFPNLHLPAELAEKVEQDLLLTSELEHNEKVVSLEELEDPLTIVREDISGVGNIINAGSLDRLVVRPNKYLEVVDIPISMDALLKTAQIHPEFEIELERLRDLQRVLPSPKPYEPEVVFLGTGSAIPSKLRNTSCILINFSHSETTNSSVMLDCGEDSYGQLFRFYGPEKINGILKRLQMIYVSHHHSDHHIGILKLISHRKKVTDQPILLLLPPGVDVLFNYHKQNFEDLDNCYKIFSTKALINYPYNRPHHEATQQFLKSDIYEKLGGLLSNISLVSVDHCLNSCAVVMEFKIGHPEMETFTIAYSGDARPCDDFVAVGKGCDLLIHEATFDHKSNEDAIEKRHSTSTEAIKVAKLMDAKYTILTHFSQKLPKIPYFTDEFDDSIGFAFDNMALRCPSHFGRLPILKPILTLVFSKSLSEIDMKHRKRELKQKAFANMIQENQV